MGTFILIIKSFWNKLAFLIKLIKLINIVTVSNITNQL